jgi:hypothetical protein
MDIKEKVSSLRSSQNLKKEEARVCFRVRIPIPVPVRRYDNSKKIRARLVNCNGYYSVIRINITKNRRSCNEITITIH